MKHNKVIIMYHSVSSEEVPGVIGSFPISMERFKHQISSLQSLGFKFDRISNLHNLVDENEKYIYITGDDGTVDWTRNVLPWCEENKIPTHTGIITGPFENEAIYPLAHLIQIILTVRDQRQLQRLTENLRENYLNAEELEYIDKIYCYEEIEYRRIIKGAFNLILDFEEAYTLIGDLSDKELLLLKGRFEELEYYKKFEYAEVGVHTRSHWALGKETQKYIDEEIEASRKLLEEHGLNPSKYFVSPMKPKKGASLDDIATELESLGYKAILDSNHGTWDQDSYIVPRIDAKNIEEIFNI